MAACGYAARGAAANAVMESALGEARVGPRAIPRWLRWTALAMLLVVLAHTGWTFYWKSRFDRRIEELRAAGIPVELTEFTLPPIPDADNANVPWMAAYRWYELHLLEGESVMEAVWVDKLGRGEATEDGKQNLLELRNWLASGDHYVELLAETVERSSMWEDLQWALGPNMELHSLPAIQRALNVLDLRVEYAGHASTKALSELALMIRLARKVNSELPLSLMVRWIGQTVGAKSVSKYAALSGFDAAAAWAQLGDLLRSGPDTDLLRHAFRTERAMLLWLTRSLVDGKDVYDESESAVTWPYRALIYRDALRALDRVDRAEEMLELSPRDAWKTAVAESEAIEVGPSTLVTGMFTGFPGSVLKMRIQYLAKMRVARVGLALLVVRQRTGSWPSSLDGVVEMVGERDVIDPYTGERLKYVPGVVLEAVGAVTDEDQREFDEIAWHFAGVDDLK